jgi:hypothetical protein
MNKTISLKDKNFNRTINGKFNNIDTRDENKQEISMQQFLHLSEAEMQCLFNPAQSHLGYFLTCQYLQLPSTQPLVPESSVRKYVLTCEQNFSIFLSRISDIQINCNQISESLLYL